MLTKPCDYVLSRGAMVSFLTKTLPNKFNKVWSFHRDLEDLSITVFLLWQLIGQHLCQENTKAVDVHLWCLKIGIL